jgi:hypothetical protein
MTSKNLNRESEAKIDDTLIATFPASDSPSWTLGVDGEPAGTPAASGETYHRRHAVLALLSDVEVARVSTAEDAAQLADGEEYIDLARPERGALRAPSPAPIAVKDVLPRSAVSEQTWAKILLAVHQGWVDPAR